MVYFNWLFIVGLIYYLIAIKYLLKTKLLIVFFSPSLIKKERQPPSPDDVIVLSDNEPSSPLMNGHCLTKSDTDKLMVGSQ